MSTLKPTNITVDRNTRVVIIEWSDHHSSSYPLSLLRYACPCAECRGGHERMGSQPDTKVFSLPDEDSPKTTIRSLEAVGTYAITVEWLDGHNYGIYNWQYLRALCPCQECRLDM
jgi:DUF971 family protein